MNISGSLSTGRALNTEMPRGSRFGTLEFPPYTAPVFAIADKHDTKVHIYADGTQLYVPFKPEDYNSTMENLKACIGDMRTGLTDNNLKLNDDKTEFIVIGQKHHLVKIGTEMSITIGDW